MAWQVTIKANNDVYFQFSMPGMEELRSLLFTLLAQECMADSKEIEVSIKKS